MEMLLLLSISLIAIIILFVAFILALIQGQDGGWIARLFGAQSKGKLVKLIGLCAIGIASLFVTLYGVLETNSRAKESAIQVNETNLKERYRHGLEYLGHTKSSVRRGGISDLHQLALDYLEVEDQKKSANIIDILLTHIQEITKSDEYRKSYRDKPSTEVQLMLDLLFQPAREKKILKRINRRADLSRAWLNRAHLIGADLSGTNLSNAQLQGANLMSAQLHNAYLWDANLQGADLKGAQLLWADLINTDLTGALLLGANFTGANLSRAQLQHAKLQYAQLPGAKLYFAQLQGANLSNAQLQGADLTGADLSNAQLQGADLSNAQLLGADLSNAQLQGADLSNAQLLGADLSNAQLQGADLNKVQLQGAYLQNANLQGTDISQGLLQWADLSNAKLQGAKLWQVGMQGAQFHNTQLQGAYSSTYQPPDSFKDRIGKRIGEKSEMDAVGFNFDNSNIGKISKQIDEEKEKMKNKEREMGLRFFIMGVTQRKELSHISKEVANMFNKSISRLDKLIEDSKNRDRWNKTNSGLVTGTYSKEDADQWIKEYEKRVNPK